MARTRVRTAPMATAAALGLLAATASILPSASAAELAPPTGLAAESPNSSTTLLSWDRDLGATTYAVEVDDSETFNSPEFKQTTTNIAAVPHTSLKSGTNHWRVRTLGTGGATSEWTTSTFVRPDVAVPSNLSPANGLELAQPDSPPLLQWSEVPGAKTYTVEIDDAEDFIGSKKYTTAATSYMPTSPMSLGTWYWRVTATDTNGQLSAASSTAHFKILALSAPELVYPTDSPNEKLEDVVLDWAPVKGAKSYELQIALNDGFEATDIKANVTGIRSTRWSPANGLNNDQYYWRVRAVDAAGSPSAWAAAPFSFMRHWPDRPWPVAPVQPEFPTYPADFDTSDPAHVNHSFHGDYVKNHDPDDVGLSIAVMEDVAPFIQWTPVQHASHYQLQISTTKDFISSSTSTCTVIGTTYVPNDTGCDIKEGTRYFWRVRPMDNPVTVNGIYSPIQKFVWQPEWFSDVSPANGTTIASPRFSWKSNVPAARYTVEIYNAQEQRVTSGTTHANSWTPVNTELVPGDGPFTWRLTATTADGLSSLIHRRTFTLDPTRATTHPDLAPLTALSGTENDEAGLLAPELSWTPHPDAAYYRVSYGHADVDAWLVPTSGQVFGRNLYYPHMTDTQASMLNPGRYKWQVTAYGEDNTAIQSSPVHTVRVAGFPNEDAVTGERIGLEGLSLSEGGGCASPLDVVNNVATCPEVPTTPVLAWDHVEGVASYMVYVSNDQNFTNLVTKVTAYNPMYAFHTITLPDNTSGVPYYWYVRPCKADGFCGPDPVSAATGMSKHAFQKVSPRVETHATPDVVTTDEVTFNWGDYHDTNQSHRVTRDGGPSWSAIYHEDASPSGAINPRDLSNQSAARYRIRVARDSLFTDVIDNQVVEQATYTSSKLYPQGPLHWSVSAIDHQGRELSSSVARQFVKSASPTQLRTPADRASQAGGIAFRWAPDAFANEYEIEVSRNDPQFSNANRLFSAKTWTTAYSWGKAIPVATTPYYWRVRRIDASGNVTVWSDVRSFTVTSPQVNLTAPAVDSIQQPNGPQFVWDQLPGAATYVFQLTNAAGKVVETRTTPATSYVPFVSLNHGQHTWSVTPRDNDGKDLAVPSVSTFTVDSAVVPESKPVISFDTERPQVGSELTVAPIQWNRPGVTESYQWLRDGAVMRGVTGSSYIASTADFDKEIAVRVTGSLHSYDNGVVTSAPVVIGAGGHVIASAPPVITGTPRVGERLSTTPGSWPSRTTITYQWLRAGKPIAGATDKTYTLTLADAVRQISVRVTGSLTAMADGTSTSAAVRVPKANSTTAMSLSTTKVQRGKVVRLTAQVTIPGPTPATGKIIVKRGKKNLRTIKLAPKHQGTRTVKLPKKKLKKGKHKIRVVFKATKKIKKSKSAVVVLRIT